MAFPHSHYCWAKHFNHSWGKDWTEINCSALEKFHQSSVFYNEKFCCFLCLKSGTWHMIFVAERQLCANLFCWPNLNCRSSFTVVFLIKCSSVLSPVSMLCSYPFYWSFLLTHHWAAKSSPHPSAGTWMKGGVWSTLNPFFLQL